MSEPAPAPVPHQQRRWFFIVSLTGTIFSIVAAVIKILDWFHIVPEQFSDSFRSLVKFIEPIGPYILPVFFLACIYWFRERLLRISRELARRLLSAYSYVLKFLLRPVLHQQEQKVETARLEPYPFEIKTGELVFALQRNEKYRQGMFIFDKPFREQPNIYITESTPNDWVYAKIDAKNLQSFTWVVARSIFPQDPGPHEVRLQWFAIAPNFSMREAGSGQLEIHRVAYGAKGIFALPTSQLRSKIKNDTLNEVCENELFGDPIYGEGKQLTIEYSFRGQRKSVTVAEHGAIKLP